MLLYNGEEFEKRALKPALRRYDKTARDGIVQLDVSLVSGRNEDRGIQDHIQIALKFMAGSDTVIAELMQALEDRQVRDRAISRFPM